MKLSKVNIENYEELLLSSGTAGLVLVWLSLDSLEKDDADDDDDNDDYDDEDDDHDDDDTSLA